MRKSVIISTFENRRLDLLNPDAGLLNLHDIARSLSRKFRYNGFLDIPIDDIYSVAQHSVYVSRLMAMSGSNANPRGRLIGLTHDVPEFILSDVITPLKRQLPDYQAIEDLWEMPCYAAFGIVPTQAELEMLKLADRYVLMMEMHQFGITFDEEAKDHPKLFEVFTEDEGEGHCMKPSEAYRFFLNEYETILRDDPSLPRFGELSHQPAELGATG